MLHSWGEEAEESSLNRMVNKLTRGSFIQQITKKKHKVQLTASPQLCAIQTNIKEQNENHTSVRVTTTNKKMCTYIYDLSAKGLKLKIRVSEIKGLTANVIVTVSWCTISTELVVTQQ